MWKRRNQLRLGLSLGAKPYHTNPGGDTDRGANWFCYDEFCTELSINGFPDFVTVGVCDELCLKYFRTIWMKSEAFEKRRLRASCWVFAGQ